MDPPLTEDGQPYGPARYKEIAHERYLISKHTNTSYSDTGNITPIERKYIIEFIVDDLQRQKDAYEKAKQQSEQKTQGRRGLRRNGR